MLNIDFVCVKKEHLLRKSVSYFTHFRGSTQVVMDEVLTRKKKQRKHSLHCLRLKNLNFIKTIVPKYKTVGSNLLWISYLITVISPLTLSSNSSRSASNALYL